jgi:hypothetical protein
MQGFQIRIKLDPDLFDLDPSRSNGSRGAIFHVCIPIRIRVVANPQDLGSLILHLWKQCLTDCSIEMTDFCTEKRVHEP